MNDVNREHTQVLMEYNVAGKVTSTYEYGNERLSYVTGKEKQYYTYDGNGSVANLTGENGTNVVSYSYDVYGTARASVKTSNPYSYNAEYVDYGTGLQYLRARYYNPNAGTFISEDSYLGELLEPLSQNRYTYAENNPLNYSDPSGHNIWKSLKKGWNDLKNAFKKIGGAISKADRWVWNKTKSLGDKINKALGVPKNKKKKPYNDLQHRKSMANKSKKYRKDRSKKLEETIKKFCTTNSRVKAENMSYVSQMGKFNPSNGKYTAVQAAALAPYLEGLLDVENIMKAVLAVFGVVIAAWEAVQLGYQLHQYYIVVERGRDVADTNRKIKDIIK